MKALVLDTVSSVHTRRVYAAALDEFFAWHETTGCGPFGKAIVQRYRSDLVASGLSAGSINHRLTTLRKLATEASDNGLIDAHLAAGIVAYEASGSRGAGSETGSAHNRRNHY